MRIFTKPQSKNLSNISIMDNKLPLLTFALRSIDKSSLEKLMATDIEEVEELKGTFEKQYGINIIEKPPPCFSYSPTLCI